MNNTHTAKYLTLGCVVLALALGGCASDEVVTTTTTETTESNDIVRPAHPGSGTMTTETRTFEQR